MSTTKYERGQNPRSLENLQPGQPHFKYESPKKQRTLTITEDGWTGVRALAEKMGLSISEIVEQIGRGTLKVEKK